MKIHQYNFITIFLILIACGCTHPLIQNYGSIPESVANSAKYCVVNIPNKTLTFDDREEHKYVVESAYLAFKKTKRSAELIDFNAEKASLKLEACIASNPQVFVVDVLHSTKIKETIEPGFIYGDKYGVVGSGSYSSSVACHTIRMHFYPSQESKKESKDREPVHTLNVCDCRKDRYDMRQISDSLATYAMKRLGQNGVFD